MVVVVLRAVGARIGRRSLGVVLVRLGRSWMWIVVGIVAGSCYCWSGAPRSSMYLGLACGTIRSALVRRIGLLVLWKRERDCSNPRF